MLNRLHHTRGKMTYDKQPAVVSWSPKLIIRLSHLDKARATGQLEADVPQRQVAETFGVSISMSSKLKARFSEKLKKRGDKEWTSKEKNNGRGPLREIFDLLTRIFKVAKQGNQLSNQIVRNRLHKAQLWARQPARKPKQNT